MLDSLLGALFSARRPNFQTRGLNTTHNTLSLKLRVSFVSVFYDDETQSFHGLCLMKCENNKV